MEITSRSVEQMVGSRVPSRPHFISGAALCAAAGLWIGASFAATADGSAPANPSGQTAELTFGVLSDVHIDGRHFNETDGGHSVRVFKMALERLRERRVDGVVICVFGQAEIPDNHESVKFVVRPMNAWGKPGEPIESAPAAYWAKGPLYPF